MFQGGWNLLTLDKISDICGQLWRQRTNQLLHFLLFFFCPQRIGSHKSKKYQPWAVATVLGGDVRPEVLGEPCCWLPQRCLADGLDPHCQVLQDSSKTQVFGSRVLATSHLSKLAQEYNDDSCHFYSFFPSLHPSNFSLILHFYPTLVYPKC